MSNKADDHENGDKDNDDSDGCVQGNRVHGASLTYHAAAANPDRQIAPSRSSRMEVPKLPYWPNE